MHFTRAECRLWLLSWLAAGLWAVQAHAIVPQRLAVGDALNFYDRGNYIEFFAELNRAGAVDRRLFDAFEKDANRWVKDSVPLRDRRTIVGASVALEIAHLLRDKPADWAGRYLVWASELMRQSPPATPTEPERLWYLASIAGMEELNEPQALTWGDPSGSAVLDPMRRSIGEGGHLAIALKRFPNEPRFLLARPVAMEWRVRDAFGLSPSYLDLARTNAALRVPTDPRSDDDITLLEIRNSAARTTRALEAIPDVVREYQALATHEVLRAEIELHLGGLESRAMRSSKALEHLRRVPALTDEPYLLYLCQLLIGRTLHNMGDNAGASAAFERASAVVPNAREAATWLAAELLMSESATDRDRAYPLLEAAYITNPTADPWRLYFHGDARLWPTYMAQLRLALR